MFLNVLLLIVCSKIQLCHKFNVYCKGLLNFLISLLYKHSGAIAASVYQNEHFVLKTANGEDGSRIRSVRGLVEEELRNPFDFVTIQRQYSDYNFYLLFSSLITQFHSYHPKFIFHLRSNAQQYLLGYRLFYAQFTSFSFCRVR